MMSLRTLCSLSALLALSSAIRAAAPDTTSDEFFETKVRPILVEHCYSCHSAGAAKIKGGLRVDSRDGLLAGGDIGPALVPGQPEKSKFIEAVTYKDVDLQMPPKGKLPDAVIADLATWVKAGAKWPGQAAVDKGGKEAFSVEKRKATHWAWKALAESPAPAVANAQWPRSSIDRFILAKLEEKGIAPARPADGHVLLRRIYFDLIGLPPTSDAIAEFERDFAAQPQAALERQIDRLLASPQFGERWARHWLDLVRYGETRGHEFDPSIPNAWQYRDYVIRAFNADVPYNQFVLEHVAGDLLPRPRLNPEKQFNESILGTGFWHLGEEVHSPVDIRGDEADRFDNRIDVFTKTFLALTVSCARCHDHKFDAVSTVDYYALYGFMRSSSYRLVRFETLEHNKRVMAQLAAVRDKQRAPVQKALAEALRPCVEQLPAILRDARASMLSGKPSANELVRFWVSYLEKAARNTDDPFHPFALLCSNGSSGPDLLKTFLIQSAAKKRAGELNQGKLEVVVDYGRLKPGQWLPDDAGFGAGPMQPGQSCFGHEPLRPIVRFQEMAAAELDPLYRGLKEAPGTQKEIGALGGHARAGRTLHTPGFTISAGPVHYLIRGNVQAYAAIDAHTVINGPLHRKLVESFDTAGRWSWVTHDLTTYEGHRAHIEFSPNDDKEFAVAMVVQGDKPQPFVAAPNAMLCEALQASDGSADKIAAVYGDLFTNIVSLLANDSLTTKSPDAARLANWMLDNAGLLGVKNWDSLKRISEPLLAEQTNLADQVRRESALALACIDCTGFNERVFVRGSHKTPGETAPRRLLEGLAGTRGIEAPGSGRLELAQQMIEPNVNPFITRVIVNRVWHHLFGKGIVGSTDNFGVLGERPTHPELLDHLAVRFAREGWSIKKLIRELMLTSAYQMASHPDAAGDAADPENLLLHRMRLRRLEGEAIRDAMLRISGQLNDKMYGPSVLIHLTPFLDGRGKPASGPIDGEGRRSIYIAVRRNFLSPMMLAFDTPSPFSTVGRRTVSNVPAQALIMMNDPFVHAMAAAWGRKMAAASDDINGRITQMYREAFTRLPTETEQENCREFLQERLKSTSRGDVRAWTDLAHVLFNVKEFIFLE